MKVWDFILFQNICVLYMFAFRKMMCFVIYKDPIKQSEYRCLQVQLVCCLPEAFAWIMGPGDSVKDIFGHKIAQSAGIYIWYIWKLFGVTQTWTFVPDPASAWSHEFRWQIRWWAGMAPQGIWVAQGRRFLILKVPRNIINKYFCWHQWYDHMWDSIVNAVNATYAALLMWFFCDICLPSGVQHGSTPYDLGTA